MVQYVSDFHRSRTRKSFAAALRVGSSQGQDDSGTAKRRTAAVRRLRTHLGITTAASTSAKGTSERVRAQTAVDRRRRIPRCRHLIRCLPAHPVGTLADLRTEIWKLTKPCGVGNARGVQVLLKCEHLGPLYQRIVSISRPSRPLPSRQPLDVQGARSLHVWSFEHLARCSGHVLEPVLTSIGCPLRNPQNDSELRSLRTQGESDMTIGWERRLEVT